MISKFQKLSIFHFLRKLSLRFSLPEIDPATSIENGGRAIARTTDGVVVLLNNGYYALVRTSTGLVESVLSIPEMLMRMARSIPFLG